MASVISYLAEDSSPASLLQAGHELIFVTAILTTLMIVISFGVAGYWFEGTVASVGGGLSIAYLTRTSFGRIDTDQLNLGFIYLLFGTLVLAGRSKNKYICIALCIVAGGIGDIFLYWYAKPQLIYLAAFSIFWILFISKKYFARYCWTLYFVELAILMQSLY